MFQKYWKSIAIAFGILVIIWGFFGIKSLIINREKLELTNICENDELIARLITKNINPFSKFKFIKKRNVDCRVLLATYKQAAESYHPTSYCSILDASTNSVTMLIHSYVNDLYDRPTAAKELKIMTKLMMPYSYCSQYYNDMTLLISLKQRLGLYSKD